MYAKKTKTHGCIWLIAAVILLAAAILLSACDKEEAKPETSSTVTTAAIPVESTAAVPATTDTAAATETETEAVQTESAPIEWEKTLNKTDISFFGPGETFTLYLPGAPAGVEVLWSSENPEVASVNEAGRVAAVGPGTTRILAKVEEETLVCWIRCQFSALPGEDEPTLDKTDISFFGPGEFYRFKVLNAPEDAEILWSSEDYSVATVDENGCVTAVGPGTIKVSAQLGDVILSSWVRCQFAAPERPHSSVADGTWKVSLRKDGITVLNEETGLCTASAALLVPVRVADRDLRDLKAGARLNLSAFGLEAYRVESVAFSKDGKHCTVFASSANLEFDLEDSGEWSLLGDDGEPYLGKGKTVKLVFDGSSVCLDQMSAVLEGRSEPIVRENVLDFFDKQPGAEEELNAVGVTVKDGVVTEALWYYHP